MKTRHRETEAGHRHAIRLTIINQFYLPDISPTAALAASLAEHRAALGDQVTVVASRGGYVPASRISEEADVAHNPRILRLWTPLLGKANVVKRCIDYACFYLSAAAQLLSLPRQDVIVSLTTPPFIAWTAILHKLLHPSTRVILWSMDCYPDAAERLGALRPGGPLSRILRRMNRALFRRLDHLVCLDTAMVELLCSQYTPEVGRPPASVIPNWEERAFFPADLAPPPWEQIKTLGLEGRFIVLYLGNTGYGHQFETVISAAEALRDEAVTFLFVGGGSRWKELEQAKRDHRLENLILHPYLPKEQTPSVLAAADCALITLRDVALGVMSPSKLHANLAMGLPIIYIGPRKSNVDDAIGRFGCGISVREGEVEQLVGFIHSMRKDRDERNKLRRRARAAFERAYCNDRTLPQFDAVLARVHSHAVSSGGRRAGPGRRSSPPQAAGGEQAGQAG